MPGQRRAILDWPYIEGLRMDEAMNPLSLLVTGVYGVDLPNQNGAPLRLMTPWKYGFKAIKSIVKIRFVEEMPVNTWQVQTPREYGFFANVNPNVSHPRWSQAGSGRIGELRQRPTLMFNGYTEQVQHMYAGMDAPVGLRLGGAGHRALHLGGEDRCAGAGMGCGHRSGVRAAAAARASGLRPAARPAAGRSGCQTPCRGRAGVASAFEK
jgi:hypothetical protein